VNTQEYENTPVSLCLSADGYIRLSKIVLESIRLRHLDSGLYDDSPDITAAFDMACELLGYTEWVTDTQPAISIGWDWSIVHMHNPPRYKMVGLPFSNIIIQDSSFKDLESEVCMNYLGVLVNQMDWSQVVDAFITKRYS